jgi:hypothetical protein
MLEKESPDEAVQREWVERAARGTAKRLRDEHRELDRRRVSERSPRGRRPLTDAEWHRSLYREPGTARARVEQLGREATVLSFANTIFSVSLPEDLAAAFLSTIESARKSLQDQARAADAGGERSGGCEPRPSLSIARKLAAHGHEIPAWVGLLALIEEFVATWDVAQNRRRPSEDAVHVRDGWRCMAPGCTSRRNLQEHHVRYRSQGGGDEMDNRLCLCAFHHQRGEHGDLASCRGLAPLGIEWSLGRGGRGGRFRNEMRVAGHATGRLNPGQDHVLVP